jgi:glycosyltransferase involved in cell wall biosynthesis
MSSSSSVSLPIRQTAPRVVIGVPVFNNAKYLARALESLLIQSYEDFSLVCVDDCSTDDSPEIVLRYAALDSRLVYEQNTHTLGLVENWRRVFEVATERFGSFDYFCWGSDHDIWHASWLEALVSELDADPTLVGAFPLSIPISAEGTPLRCKHQYWDTTGFADPLQRLLYVAKGFPPKAGSIVYGLFRADALQRCGVYLPVIEPDVLLLSQLALLGPMKQVRRALWQRRFFSTKPARKRQRSRSRLFRGRAPLHAFLPVPIVHAAVLCRWAVIDGSARPEVGRLRGAAAVVAFLPVISVKRVNRRRKQRRKALRKATWRRSPRLKMFMKRRKKRRKQRRKRLRLARKTVFGHLRRITLLPSKLARRSSRRDKT